jgi:hypothetical protein
MPSFGERGAPVIELREKALVTTGAFGCSTRGYAFIHTLGL